MSSFKYISSVLIDLYYKWILVVGNSAKAQKKWAHMLQILRREGTNVHGLGTLFKTVDQGVLLFGSKTWVMNPAWLLNISALNKAYWVAFVLILQTFQGA